MKQATARRFLTVRVLPQTKTMQTSYIIQCEQEDDILRVHIHTFHTPFTKGFIHTGSLDRTYELTDINGVHARLDELKAKDLQDQTIQGRWFSHTDPFRSKTIIDRLTRYCEDPAAVGDENLYLYADEVITENLSYLHDWTIEYSMTLTEGGLQHKGRFVSLPSWTYNFI